MSCKTYDVGADTGPSDSPMDGMSIKSVLMECVSSSSCSAPISEMGLHLNICTKYFVINTLRTIFILVISLLVLYTDAYSANRSLNVL